MTAAEISSNLKWNTKKAKKRQMTRFLKHRKTKNAIRHETYFLGLAAGETLEK